MTMTATTRSEAQILQAIADTLTYTGSEWAELGALRDESGLSRPEFDRTMTRLAVTGQVVLIPEENQKTLTSGDRYNALTVGGEPKHLAQIA